MKQLNLAMAAYQATWRERVLLSILATISLAAALLTNWAWQDLAASCSEQGVTCMSILPFVSILAIFWAVGASALAVLPWGFGRILEEPA